MRHPVKTNLASPCTPVTALHQVLNGQSWVLVDGAIIEVSEFAQGHPGGARLILNGVGTDVTHELLGHDLSVGHAMSFTPHVHPEVRTGVHGHQGLFECVALR